MVVETMEKEHLSIYATMQEFGINDHKIIERWERIYLEEGPEGLSVERRGPSKARQRQGSQRRVHINAEKAPVHGEDHHERQHGNEQTSKNRDEPQGDAG